MEIPFGPVELPGKWIADLDDGEWLSVIDIKTVRYPDSLGLWPNGRNVVPLEIHLIEGNPEVRLQPHYSLRYYNQRIYPPLLSRPIGFYGDIRQTVVVEGVGYTSSPQTDDSVLILLKRIESKIDALP